MRKRDVLVIVLGVSGCASPGGRTQQLRQAAPAYTPMPARAPAPVRMGNTYRPMGTTLYGAGEAAPHGEEVPRSPNKRVLPPTKEPGVWAADGAQVPVAGLNPPSVLDCVLPVPRTSQGEAMPGFAVFCAAHMEGILREPVFLTTSPWMSSRGQQECLAAKMYQLCAETMRLSQSEPDASGEVAADNEITADWRKWSGETAKVATAYRRDKCKPETETPAVRKVYSLVHREWLRLHLGTAVPND